ncbi:MAG: hypothetical protein MR487_08710 [Lachnospiraceae bacterium]|nr:hypothetical protein [Lachnospiraceae bacterium]
MNRGIMLVCAYAIIPLLNGGVNLENDDLTGNDRRTHFLSIMYSVSAQPD